MESSLTWAMLCGAIMTLILHGVPMVGGADTVTADGLQKDTQGLLSLKQTIEKDPFGMLDGWGASATNSCEWRGVTCVNGRVAALDLSNGGLRAPLPTSALAPLDQLRELRLQGNALHGYGTEQVVDAACTTLTVLDLSSNNLTGGFTASATVVCTTLTYLNLSRNSLSGSLLSFGLMGADQNSLTTLDLSYNNFSGSLPSQSFSKCGSLAWLDLSHNSLMGGIPEGVSACATLLHLDLSYNLFISALPPDILSPISSASLNASTSLTYLDLSSNHLTGSLPDSLQSPVLLSLDLSNNFFIGPIPPSLSSSTALRLLNLSFNSLSGPIPPSLSSLANLRGLYLADNNFTGSIPSELGSSALTALEELDLSNNQLVGNIPASFSNLSALQYLNLGINILSGEFPRDVVCVMPALHSVIISFNNLTGALPSEGLADCKLLSVLDLSANRLTGGVPDSFCAPQLQKLLLQDNDLVGTVPEVLGNCTSLIIVDLSCNLLSGPLPASLARLPLLQELMIWGNSLTGPISPSFGGALYLRKLILNLNLLSGTIPSTLANCSNLEWLSLSSNMLTGIIPPEIGSMQNLGILQLADNRLTGVIPAALGSCSKLIWLNLNNNLLEGTIPIELANQAGKVTRGTLNQGTEYAFLKNLDIECKGLGGLIEYNGIRDETLFQLKSVKESCKSTLLYHGRDPYYFPINGGGSLEYVDLGFNRLTGTIPAELGSLSYLLVLSLSHNALTGSIPSSFSNLAVLTILYLDHNMLQGHIPPSLGALGLINQLDLSNNNLTGPIPQTGSMSTLPASSFANNPGLCDAPLQPCGYTSTSATSDSSGLPRRRSSRGWSVIAITMSAVGACAIVVACACGMAACLMVKKHKMKQNMRDGYMDNLPSGSDSNSWNMNGAGEPLSINVATFEKPLRKLTFAHLLEATDGFSAKAMIGHGGFGDVYKASLEDGVTVAIKKLAHTIGQQGDREFMAEMETLGKIKHRNLVPLLGYCRVGQERLLVYEYMEGGSLDKRLHGDCMDMDEGDLSSGEPHRRDSLSWEMRKRIALGTARGLCFLHHNCIPHIIHRDLKSSNVLLDDALEARVSDFGMARLVSAAETHLSVSSLVGTPGYVPPEYCHSFRCTTKGDVYSFGVVLLELITGKRPTWSSSAMFAKSKGVPVHYLSPVMSESDADTTSSTSGTSIAAPISGTTIREESEEDEDSVGGIDLVGWVKKQLKSGKPTIDILDKTALLGGGGAIIPPNKIVVQKEMLRYLQIACWCVEQSPHRRPNMLEVMSLFRELNQDHELDSL